MIWDKKLILRVKKIWKFITLDLWRPSDSVLNHKKKWKYNLIKILFLAIKRFQEDNMSNRASALTYSSLLSVVPMLAVLLAVAKGFGFNNIVESQLFNYFPGQKIVIGRVLSFVDSYMKHTGDGIFLGLGLILLLYTILNLISGIENTFNNIWQVSKGRTYLRKISDYFSVLLILPVFLICSSGISIFMNTVYETISNYSLLSLGHVYEILLKIIPVFAAISAFTCLYIYMPNTKVKFVNALYGGIFGGIGFQIFQYLYINGQIWVSKYNAIYGSFAVLPLLLLWMQLSWIICLLGAEITYAGQNVNSYDFEKDSKNISRRYSDFLILSIATIIVKRFSEGKPAYTPDEISENYRIPVRLTNKILFKLVNVGIINEIKDEDEYPNYQPAIDINMISVNYLFTKIDNYGSENFFIDKKIKLSSEWETILELRKDMYSNVGNILLKDL